MKRNNGLSVAIHRLREAVPALCLLFCCFALTTFFGCAIGATFEMVGFMKGMTTQLEEREAFLVELAEKPLTENQEKLLNELLHEEESLDAVLSSQAYLTYLGEHGGAAHKDYPMYLAAVPTTEQKLTIRFALKEILPSEATTEQIQICTDFYFEFRELIVKEPDITSDSEAMEAFIQANLVTPLMDTYSSELSSVEAIGIMKIGVVPPAMTIIDRDVFHKTWFKQLEVYGSREGLLRCAILTPDEFALMRSFFKNTAALERWIKRPPEQK